MDMVRKIREPRAKLTQFARHEGVWDGNYRYYDAQGQQIDEHRSRVVCRFPRSDPYPYHQTNHYCWADGRLIRRTLIDEEKVKHDWSGYAV